METHLRTFIALLQEKTPVLFAMSVKYKIEACQNYRVSAQQSRGPDSMAKLAAATGCSGQWGQQTSKHREMCAMQANI
jgi:hypothetical protein